MKTTFFAFFAWLLRYFFAILPTSPRYGFATVSLGFRLGSEAEAKLERRRSEYS